MFNIKGKLYRLIMRIAHHYNWHYAPPTYPDGDTMLWCKWCGFREVIRKKGDKPSISIEHCNSENLNKDINDYEEELFEARYPGASAFHEDCGDR